MNLVSVLIAPAIVSLTVGTGASPAIRYGIAAVAFVIVIASVAYSKSKDIAIGNDSDPDAAAAEQQHPVSHLGPIWMPRGRVPLEPGPSHVPVEVPRRADAQRRSISVSRDLDGRGEPTPQSRSASSRAARAAPSVSTGADVTGRASVASSSARNASGSTSCS